jgi:hypothetical protein
LGVRPTWKLRHGTVMKPARPHHLSVLQVFMRSEVAIAAKASTKKTRRKPICVTRVTSSV